MTKINLPLLSQNDARWQPLTLGYNPPNQGWTIGNYGCLITCLSMYLTGIGKPTNPDQLNTNLCNNGGYQTNTGNLYWSVFETLYGVKTYYESPKYTGPLTAFAYAKLDELLAAGYPVLTEIDYNPSQEGEQMHYVYILEKIGEKQYKANDPWSGTYIDMNVYGSMDLSVYKFRAYDKKPPANTEPDCEYFKNAFLSLCDILKIPYNRETAEREARKFVAYEDEMRAKDELLKQKDAQVGQVQAEAKQLREQLTAVQESNKSLTDQAEKLKNELTEEQLTMQKMDLRIAELEKIQPVEAYSGIQLIVMGIKKVFRIG